MAKKLQKLGAFMVSLLFLVSGLAFATSTTGHTLESYPEPFLKDGKLNKGLIVVGRDAATSDVIGAVEIGANLQALATTKAEIEIETSEPIVTGGKSEKLTLGAEVNDELGDTLEDNDLEGLKDGKVDFDNTNYDYREIVILGDDLKVVTSLTGNDEDYEDNVFMEVRAESIKYQFKFDDSIDLNEVDEDDPLKIEFLGDHLKIIDVDDNSITVQLGKEIYLKQGKIFDFEDDDKEYKIKLDGVDRYSSKAVILIADLETDPEKYEQKIIELDDSEIIGDLEIRLDAAFSNSDTGDAVVIIVGTDTRETYDDGDEYIGEDKHDPEWVWDLSDLESNDKDLITLGVVYDLTKDSYDDDEPVNVGECYISPNDYFKICLDSLTEEEYTIYTLEYDDSYSSINDVYSGASDEKVFVLESSEEDGIKLAGSNEDTNELVIWVKDTGVDIEVFYLDEDENDLLSDNIYAESSGTVKIASIEYEDTSLDVMLDIPADLTSGTVVLRIESPIANDDLEVPLTVNAGDEFEGIGPNAEDADAEDTVWNGKNIGTREEDALTVYGIRLRNPESGNDNDELEFEVPGDQVEANVVASGIKTTINALTADVGVHLNEFDSPLSKLDTEATDYKDFNVIVVGGPCVNDVASSLREVELSTTTDDCTVGFESGKAMIRFIEDTGKGNSAIVIAGFSAEDTRNAAHAFVNNEFMGAEATVVSTGGLYQYEIKNEPMSAGIDEETEADDETEEETE